MADEQKAPNSAKGESKDPPWLKIITASAAIVAILAFFGISNFTQLEHMFSGGGHSPAPSPVIPASHSPSDSPSSPSPAPATSTESQGLSPSPASDPDFVNTDLTPLTAASLLPQTLTDSVHDLTYTRVASGNHPCNGTSFMSSATAATLTSNGCTLAMTGDYIEDSSLDPGSHILVSVQIFPFASLSTAMQVESDFPSGGTWDFGIYCPLTGLGSTTCNSHYADARKSEWENYHHRYLVEATAVYVNLNTSTQVLPWLKAAAQAAVSACGPQNYPGNE